MPSITRSSEDAVPTRTPRFWGFDVTLDRSKLGILHVSLVRGYLPPYITSLAFAGLLECEGGLHVHVDGPI